MNIGIAGIHTGIGKTVCSAVICEALGFDYWKPVQAGDLDNSDSIFIQNHVGNPACRIFPERYRLLQPMSPHAAAALENIQIKKQDFVCPETADLVVETAGGLMSPLSDELLNIDLLAYLELPVILVSNNYLGSINHTLLSHAALKSRHIQILGLVFTGPANPASETFIVAQTGLPVLFSIPQFDPLDAAAIHHFASHTRIKIPGHA